MAEKASSSAASSGDAMMGNDDPNKRPKAQAQRNSCASSMEETTNASFSSAECPLFMEGLPSDFASNAGLAAIASLLDDDGEEKKGEITKKKHLESTIHLKSGGGKVKKTSKLNNPSPYNKRKNKDEKKNRKASLGEAQLFLNMWKI
eukprot:CAMPEP_0172553776 /NCGR_PEP_ID=MMETSP1067-20121228/51663_1 /TAXON_ID=265564 ORGANISM="Thalassiosira punctigera, Strain Tpunct2005C2" /NCGR_SAMPLE_ID=MMETSP1067 /ASSEMBLY_ACC=CAM_ASM_000444 /LENGTH=146 /DNA_ID=CAMNT_0013342007 /DNA_START=99 /DNA_END=539 /DNA_ORIENTATION=+